MSELQNTKLDASWSYLLTNKTFSIEDVYNKIDINLPIIRQSFYCELDRDMITLVSNAKLKTQRVYTLEYSKLKNPLKYKKI